MSRCLFLTMTEPPAAMEERRCLEKCVVFRRWACEQVEPGAADPNPLAKALPSPQPGWLMRLYRAYAA